MEIHYNKEIVSFFTIFFFLNFLSFEHCIFSSLHIFLGVSAVLLSAWNLSGDIALTSENIYAKNVIKWYIPFRYLLKILSAAICAKELQEFASKNLWFHGPLELQYSRVQKVTFLTRYLSVSSLKKERLDSENGLILYRSWGTNEVLH